MTFVTGNRAIIFDLDDTLYRQKTFVFSGFRAVAERIEQDRRIPAPLVFRVLRQAFESPRRGRELQALCEGLALPNVIVPELISVMRDHKPGIRLPARTVEVLRRLRPSWRIGVLTNGIPDVQKRKVAALELNGLVDTVVYAEAHGDGRGKPAPEGFQRVLDELRVSAAAAVFVGDNPATDMAGAASIGMASIRLVSRDFYNRAAGDSSQAVASTLRDVPSLAWQLLEDGRTSRVA